MNPPLLSFLAVVSLASPSHSAPYFSVGGGTTRLTATELPIYASFQSDEAWVPTVNLACGWDLNSHFSAELSGSATDKTRIHTDPTTAYIPPFVRFATPTTLYEVSQQSIAARIRFKKTLSDRISGHVGAGPALLFTKLKGLDSHEPQDYSGSGSGLTLQVVLGLDYHLDSGKSIALRVEHHLEREIDRGVRFNSTGLQVAYSARF